ncbi:MAG: hypothetical protein FWF24_01795 [Alphaproteobacteria bacterium]|nr:hypothetical protein [Alphaproteobacteria bacterium]
MKVTMSYTTKSYISAACALLSGAVAGVTMGWAINGLEIKMGTMTAGANYWFIASGVSAVAALMNLHAYAQNRRLAMKDAPQPQRPETQKTSARFSSPDGP